MTTQPGDIEERLIDAQTLHQRSELLEDLEDTRRELCVPPMGRR
jgi:hypothetical protein